MIFHCDMCVYYCLQLMKRIILFTLIKYGLNSFPGAIRLNPRLFKGGQLAAVPVTLVCHSWGGTFSEEA